MRRRCERCGVVYTPRDALQLYCGVGCRQRTKRKRQALLAKGEGDRLLPPTRTTPGVGPPVLAAADGSGTDRHHDGVYRAGWAWVVSEHEYDFGPCEPGEFHELAAVTRLLDAVDVDQPLTVLTDNQEVCLRLRDGYPPRSSNPYADAWWRAMAEVRRRPLTVVRVLPDVQPHPLHSLAHWLAYLGREGGRPVPGRQAVGAAEVLASEDPERTAHELTRRASLSGSVAWTSDQA